MAEDQVISVPPTEVEFSTPEPNLKATYNYCLGYLIGPELTTKVAANGPKIGLVGFPDGLEDSCSDLIFKGLEHSPFILPVIFALEKEVDVTERLKREAQSKT